jgi:hypothetical protein
MELVLGLFRRLVEGLETRIRLALPQRIPTGKSKIRGTFCGSLDLNVEAHGVGGLFGIVAEEQGTAVLVPYSETRGASPAKLIGRGSPRVEASDEQGRIVLKFLPPRGGEG